MQTIINSLKITESTRATTEAVLALSPDDQLKVLEAVMLGELNITKEGLGYPTERKTGPRGPTDKVKPRLEACRAQMHVAKGGCAFAHPPKRCVHTVNNPNRDQAAHAW